MDDILSYRAAELMMYARLYDSADLLECGLDVFSLPLIEKHVLEGQLCLHLLCVKLTERFSPAVRVIRWGIDVKQYDLLVAVVLGQEPILTNVRVWMRLLYLNLKC